MKDRKTQLIALLVLGLIAFVFYSQSLRHDQLLLEEEIDSLQAALIGQESEKEHVYQLYDNLSESHEAYQNKTKAEISLLKNEKLGLERHNRELRLSNNTIITELIKYKGTRIQVAQLFEIPQITLKDMEMTAFESDKVMVTGLPLRIAPYYMSPHFMQLGVDEILEITRKVEVTYMGAWSIWYAVQIDYGFGGSIEGWIPLESVKPLDEGAYDNDFVRTKPSMTAYYVADEVFSMDNPVVIVAEKTAYLLKKKDAFALIQTLDGNMYWVHEEDITYGYSVLDIYSNTLE